MRAPGSAMVAAALLLWAGSVAVAQPAPEAPADPEEGDKEARTERARRFYADARRQHEAGEYGEAAANYLAAYRELPRPGFLYNAAQVFRLGGELEKALVHYRRYLELDPDGEGAGLAREFIASIEKKLARPTGGDDPGAGDDAGAEGGAVGEEGAEDSRSDPLPVIDDPALEARGRSKRLIGLGVAGVGAALIGAGVGFGLHARSLSAEASGFRGPYSGDLDDLYARGEAANRNLVILVSAGALTVAAGGVVYLLGVRERNRARRDLEIFAGPTPGGLVLGIGSRWE